MWPATVFSVACGSIQEKSSNMKFIENYVEVTFCLIELLTLDKAYLHKNNYNITFSVYHNCFNHFATTLESMALR